MTAIFAPSHDAVIIGAGYAGLWVAGELRQSGLNRIVILGYPQFGAEVTAEVFDDTTDLWTVYTRCGTSYTARVLVATCDLDGHSAAGFGDARTTSS
ncbi:hypothetical protein [Mycobacteroides salmoniphilum]|uniref:FAD/NAD(P)-binding domain-containing protein n=1 Tax=Mycobacteroides salmoniphilum TaxID=404941 RepID=A0A4R8S9M3_9MYCO|nr:hypothetical protein [Mycobacteroides salmoniphilum]TDZ89791.1 hypothetical protein CCUG60885_05007 [Mycobacteroides salmoniphilum]TEA00890.1 hypothetical protein CCUG60883_04540 [Mycobacteroides salmoniphilum]